MGVENSTALAFILYIPDLETLTIQQLWQTLATSIFSVNDNPCNSCGTSPSQFALTKAFLGVLLWDKLCEQDAQIFLQEDAMIGPMTGLTSSLGDILACLAICILSDCNKLLSKFTPVKGCISLLKKSIPQHAQPSSVTAVGLMSWQ